MVLGLLGSGLYLDRKIFCRYILPIFEKINNLIKYNFFLIVKINAKREIFKENNVLITIS